MDLLAGLEGTFKGHGKGSFPTIQPFSYGEEVTFKRLGTKNVFSYVQRTWNQETQAPMHAESGFLRVFDDRMVEFVLAQPTGLAEIEHGRCYLNDHGLVCMDTEAGQETKEGGKGLIKGDRNKDPKTHMVVRRFVLQGNTLRYKLLLATSTTPQLTHHLEAELHRVP